MRYPQGPKCPKCGADGKEFHTDLHEAILGTWLILYCNKCGTVLDTVFSEE